MDEPKNHLFQYSIISSLMDGVASSGIPLIDLLKHGDLGLGTFKQMVGEMIILDGAIYQMKSDGSTTAIPEASAADRISPFAMVTRFQPTAVDDSASFASKDALGERLAAMLPRTRNVFVAFRADGVFTATVRTAAGQQHPREPLRSVSSRQATHTFERERGTIVGFRSPAFSHGISVAGDHMHFISHDRLRGGHVLALDSGTDHPVRLAAAPIATIHLQLPVDDDEYDQAELKLDSQGIHAVEG